MHPDLGTADQNDVGEVSASALASAADTGLVPSKRRLAASGDSAADRQKEHRDRYLGGAVLDPQDLGLHLPRSSTENPSPAISSPSRRSEQLENPKSPLPPSQPRGPEPQYGSS